MEKVNNSVLRHKPGLISKHRYIDRPPGKTANSGADQTSDPLNGNYTVVKLDSIMASFQGVNNNLELMSFTAQPYTDKTNGLGVAISDETSLSIEGGSNFKQMVTISADIDGNKKDEIIVAYLNDKNELWLEVIKYEEGAKTSNYAVLSRFIIEAEIGDQTTIWGSYTDEGEIKKPVIAWVDKSNKVKIWTCDNIADDTKREPFLFEGPETSESKKADIAIGAFTGQRNNEIAIFYEGKKDSNGNNLFVSVYYIANQKSKLINSAIVGATDKGYSPYTLNVKSGAFLANTVRDGLALSWAIKETDKAQLQMWECHKSNAEKANNQFDLKMVDAAKDLVVKGGLIRTAVGDINDDGVEELVVGRVANELIEGHLVLQVYRFENTLKLSPASTGRMYGDNSFNFISFDFELAIADLENHSTPGLDNNYIGAGIVIATLGAEKSLMPQNGYARVSLGVIKVDPELNFAIRYKEKPAGIPGLFSGNIAYDSNKNLGNLKIKLTHGDFNGTNICVGSPKQSTIEDVNSIIAIINFPPIPSEFQNTEEFNCVGQVSFSDTKGNSTSMGLSTHRSYSTSDSLGSSLGISSLFSFTSSINKTHGKDFSKSTDKIADITTSLNVSSDKEDVILLNVNIFNTWEYPVYKDGVHKGHILVVFPQSSGNIKTLSGKDLSSLYKPAHLIGNILSYPSADPKDYDAIKGSFCNAVISVDSQPTSISANWSNSNNQSEQKSVNQSTHISNQQSANVSSDFLCGFSLGINHNYDNTYSNSESSNYAINFTESTNIDMSITPAGLNETMYYTVKPYVYWCKTGNYLKVDYAVFIPKGSTWFTQKYNESNPCFHLPWITDGYKLFTRDIEFVQSDNDSTTILVTVHNDTLKPTAKIELALYNKDPHKNGTQIGDIQTINGLPARGAGQCIFTVKTSFLESLLVDGYTTIYAAINPKTTLKNLNDHNKIGFGYYPSNYLSGAI
nr:hypothetical protein [Pedobacter panaciterrae]